MPALWLITLAWFSLGLAFLCAASILDDIYLRGYRQKMWTMEPVWPITASVSTNNGRPHHFGVMRRS